MAELHCIGYALALGVRVEKLEAPIRAQGGSIVESLLCLKVPRPPCDRFSMDEYPTTNRTKRRLVEDKTTLEVLPKAPKGSMQMTQTFGHAANDTKDVEHSITLLVKEIVGDLGVIGHCP